MHFTIWRSKNDQFYFELVADNNETVAVSELYTRKESAENTIASIKKGAAGATVLDCSNREKYDRDLP